MYLQCAVESEAVCGDVGQVGDFLDPISSSLAGQSSVSLYSEWNCVVWMDFQ